jgi:replication-associated recombination protein RarA
MLTGPLLTVEQCKNDTLAQDLRPSQLSTFIGQQSLVSKHLTPCTAGSSNFTV